MEGLDKFLKDEQKYVKAIEQVERERQHTVASLIGNQSQSTSLTDVVKYVSDEERGKLLGQRERLLQLVNQLKSQNQLNQQLIYNSLQYVNLTLDMLRPAPPADFNYKKPTNAAPKGINRGMFDSKA